MTTEEKKYFNNLDLNKITDNKLFWKTLKPLLPDKSVNNFVFSGWRKN